MQKVVLDFWGYTWDEFRGLVGDLLGIVLVYKGRLDSEGFPKMEELLFIDYSSINKIADSEVGRKIRGAIKDNDRLFFSYAEVSADLAHDVLSKLIYNNQPRYNNINTKSNNLIVVCKGCCELVLQ